MADQNNSAQPKEENPASVFGPFLERSFSSCFPRISTILIIPISPTFIPEETKKTRPKVTLEISALRGSGDAKIKGNKISLIRFLSNHSICRFWMHLEPDKVSLSHFRREEGSRLFTFLLAQWRH